MNALSQAEYVGFSNNSFLTLSVDNKVAFTCGDSLLDKNVFPVPGSPQITIIKSVINTKYLVKAVLKKRKIELIFYLLLATIVCVFSTYHLILSLNPAHHSKNISLVSD